MRRCRWGVAVLALLLALLSMSGTVHTVSGQPPTPTDMAGAWPAELRAHDRPVGAISARAAAPSVQRTQSADIYRYCSRLAYQSWLDDNWEIVYAYGDGSNPIRLTFNDVFDEAPALTPDAKRIAFSSDRGDNEDIYSMLSDGSDLVRVTYAPERDVLPAVAPDGLGLAFQSYRDAEAPEVYRTGCTGGCPTRLTHNTFYDGQPRWSPDGNTLAYVSARSGENNVWLMDTDGSNQRQLTSLPYVGGPVWSPNGSRIAFAADDLHTGFTALWIINVDGSDPHLVWRPRGESTDVWPGAWSHDGRYILYEQANWGYDNGWYIESSSLQAINPDDPLDRHELVGGGIALAPSAAFVDEQPPASGVAPLPEASTSPITVTWSGGDRCSPPVEYQIQYRVGRGGSWRDWDVVPGQEWITHTQAVFSRRQDGVTVYFRSRARDSRGHVEPWPGGPGDARTTFPVALSGMVADARGVPLRNATVTTIGDLETTDSTTQDGSYSVAVAGDPPIAVDAQREGYLGQRHVLPAVDETHGLRFYLSTEPEQLTNGGFESGQTGWFATGNVSFETSNLGYGNRLLRLGRSPYAGAHDVGLAQPPIPAVWRSFLLPGELRSPTLSLRYVLGDGTGADVGVFSAVIETDGEQAAVAQAKGPTAWHEAETGSRYPLWDHAYADLSPWAGQTVTLTLRYDPQGTYQELLLDQVSVAPWRTPLVRAVEPVHVRPRETVTLTVAGVNFTPETDVYLGALYLPTDYVNETTLRARVSRRFPPGTYDVWTREGPYQSHIPEALQRLDIWRLPLIYGPHPSP